MSAEQPRSHGRSPWRDAYELLMQRPERPSTPPESSVTISRNAKGHFQFEVTVRGPQADECADEADRLTQIMVAAYPYPLEGAVSPQDATHPPDEVSPVQKRPARTARTPQRRKGVAA